MTLSKLLAAAVVIGSVAGCVGPVRQGEEYLAFNEEALFGVRNIFGNRANKTTDVGLIDRSDLASMRAGIWVDPNGCQHWIIDDGVEGYLSARLDVNGRPVCDGQGEPTYAYGNFKGGATRIIGDSQ